MSRDASNPIPQACAVPYRVAGGQIEVCVVTSMKKRRWTFPKGIVEPGETPGQAALKEAWEEAGIRGTISGPTLGSYERKKWGEPVNVVCYLMQVEREFRIWPESALRERQWVPLEEAVEAIACRGQRELLLAATARLKRRRSQAG